MAPTRRRSRRLPIAAGDVMDTAQGARLIAILLLVAACGGGGVDATAAPALIRVVEGVNAIAPIAPAPTTVPGVITFGTAYDPKTLTRFKRTLPEIAWSADLSRGVDAASMSWVVVRRSTSGVEKAVFNVDE